MRAGLLEDDITIALSKYASKSIKCVTNNIKSLIDLKKPDAASSVDDTEKAKSIDDLIEDKIIELTKENLKDEDLEKKKKEILTELCKVTGKKPPLTDEEEKKLKEEEEEKKNKEEKAASEEEEKKEEAPSSTDSSQKPAAGANDASGV